MQEIFQVKIHSSLRDTCLKLTGVLLLVTSLPNYQELPATYHVFFFMPLFHKRNTVRDIINSFLNARHIRYLIIPFLHNILGEDNSRGQNQQQRYIQTALHLQIRRKKGLELELNP